MIANLRASCIPSFKLWSRCRYDAPPRRNRDVEAIIEQCTELPLRCRHRGCAVELKRPLLASHELQCDKKPDTGVALRCPVAKCLDRSQFPSLVTLDMHHTTCHEEDLVTAAKKHILQFPINVAAQKTFNGKVLVISHEEAGLSHKLYCNLVKRGQRWHYWLTLKSGSRHEAERIRYDVKFTNLVTRDCCEYSGASVYSLLDGQEDILKRARHNIIIENDQFKKYLGRKGNASEVKVTLEIRNHWNH